jgi:hypothetical protein
MSEAAAKRFLAQWRRQGHGIWRIVFIAEGYDDEFVHLVPGKLSKTFAVRLARKQCADALNESTSKVHIKSVTKEP